MSLLLELVNKAFGIFKPDPKKQTRSKDLDLVSSIGIIRNISGMGSYVQIPNNENMALIGVELFQQGKFDHPLVKKWLSFVSSVQTNGDVWKFFCDCHAFDPELIRGHYDYDDVWFQDWSNTPVEKGTRFGVSQKHMEELWEIEPERESADVTS